MPYCGNCGNYINEGEHFCSTCGTKVASSSGSATKQTSQQTIPRPAYSQSNPTSNYDEDIQSSKVYAILAYLGILFFLPLVVTPNSKYGRYHANQGLLLLIVSAILGFVGWLLQVIVKAIFQKELVYYGMHTGIRTLSNAGSVICIIIAIIVIAVIALLILVGMLNAANGKTKPLPVIGGFTLIR